MHRTTHNQLTFQIFWIVLLSAGGIQLFYFLFFFSGVAFGRTKKLLPVPREPLSVVICARNEAENLKENLPLILGQDYPDFEVIVVNDNSTDDTTGVLHNLSAAHPKLQIRNITQESKGLHGKKFALTVGIKAAQHKTVVLTDADCAPSSRDWLALFQRNFQRKIEVVIGYAPFKKEKGLLNRWVRFDAFWNGLQYLSLAKAGIPYMGVGRNLAYKKELFFSNNVFVKHPNLMSGDDDLFVNHIARRKNVAVEIDAGSFMISPGKSNREDWSFQKQRNLSTERHYKWIHQILLSLFSLSHIMFFLTAIPLALYSPYWLWTIIALGIRFVFLIFIVGFSMRRLRETDLIWLLPIFDLFLTVYYLSFATSLFKRRNNRWK